jgi:hypothetical protein
MESGILIGKEVNNERNERDKNKRNYNRLNR